MSRHRKALKRIANKVPAIERILTERNDLRRVVGILEIEKKQLIEDNRISLSHKFIRGSGIEIGALHMPLSLRPGTKVKYVDYIPLHKLREQYAELKDLPLVNVDIVDNGEKLSKLKDSSLDFIIANHFLEHCQDPIGTLITFYKKLRGDGILYMAIPDKRYTFDIRRPITNYAHLLEEHRIYPSRKYYAVHCREVIRLTHGVRQKKKIDKNVKELVDINYSIHHHVWTQKELMEFFYKTAMGFKLDIEVEAMTNNMHEVVFVIRKLDARKESKKIKDIRKRYFSD